MKSLSRVQIFVTSWTIAYQAPPSMGFSRHEYWSGLPFPSPGGLPDLGIKPGSPTLEANALTSEPPGKTNLVSQLLSYCFLLTFSTSCYYFWISNSLKGKEALNVRLISSNSFSVWDFSPQVLAALVPLWYLQIDCFNFKFCSCFPVVFCCKIGMQETAPLLRAELATE